MKSCDNHERCVVAYSEDWRVGLNGCPLCNLAEHNAAQERDHEKYIDKMNEKVEELRDRIAELEAAGEREG